ncbi:MAG: acyl-CoA dehydrogenase family protein, partial [Rhodospirillaceae bacterium]
MPGYVAPLAEMRFVLRHLAGLPDVCALPAHAELTRDVIDAVLDEAARFAQDVIGPLNESGDREGARLENGRVHAPSGFAQAYRAYVEAGWNGISAPPAYGGQGLPHVLAQAVDEMWNSASLAYALAPMLTSGVVRALLSHGSAAQQALYLPPLVAGRWCGTMNLTEPQAGSDLSALRTMATPEGDAYRLRGTKVFITWGDHDLAENIVHLVLARTPDAPAGVKGISLFIVPKWLVGADGTLGERNDITCVALERKTGIHGSPTCVLNYGERTGAVGYLVGEVGRGLEYMFTMMNHARLGVGLEGVALAERACQAAVAYAQARIQGRDITQRSDARVPIVRHPDVRRMLLSMKVRTEAMRAITYYAAAADDLATSHPDVHARRRYQARVDLLTPVVKGWCTEQAVDIAALGMQVHGGMGYVEDTGVAQYWRDARITPIYEGTTGIQANDLVGRKVAADGGVAAREFMAQMHADVQDAARDDEPLRPAAALCAQSIDDLDRATGAL